MVGRVPEVKSKNEQELVDLKMADLGGNLEAKQEQELVVLKMVGIDIRGTVGYKWKQGIFRLQGGSYRS